MVKEMSISLKATAAFYALASLVALIAINQIHPIGFLPPFLAAICAIISWFLLNRTDWEIAKSSIIGTKFITTGLLFVGLTYLFSCTDPQSLGLIQLKLGAAVISFGLAIVNTLKG